MSKTKFRVAAAMLAVAAMIGLGISLFLHYSRAAEQDAAKDVAQAEKLYGEWSFTTSRDRPNDTEIVWTFRPNGLFRIDAIDRNTRKQIRGMAVGLWRVEKGDLHLVEELWNDKYLSPFQARERLWIRSVSESELVLQPLEANNRRATDRKELSFTRFAGWPRKPEREDESVLKAVSDTLRRFVK